MSEFTFSNYFEWFSIFLYFRLNLPPMGQLECEVVSIRYMVELCNRTSVVELNC